ncbi:MAG: VOC family protein [Halioglobus sp.]|nr:VOC family protein [Halioglobus sp.]
MSRQEPDTNFSFSKLVVDDLETSARFYEQVCQLVERARHNGKINGEHMTEITYQPTRESGPSLTLVKFDDQHGHVCGESILGFITDDLDAFLERAQSAGGKVTDPTREVPAYNVRVAFVEDNEGHLMEVIQVL